MEDVVQKVRSDPLQPMWHPSKLSVARAHLPLLCSHIFNSTLVIFQFCNFVGPYLFYVF